jgi:methylated-DNA-protein-cysteine methyltransferase-like protein
MNINRKKTPETLPFTDRVKELIKKIPKGKVSTYGHIAAFAGNPHGARQVVRILNSSSRKDKLPWHRIVNRQGRISLKPNQGYEIQKVLLEKEGIRFGNKDTIDFDRYLWSPL